jgi:hypothetical protein
MGWPPEVIDTFFAEYLGCDLAAMGPGEVVVAGSSRRYAPEPHHDHVFALWLVASGNRCAISVQKELVWPVQQVTKGADVEGLTGSAGRALLAQTVTRLLRAEGRVTTGSGPILHCASGSLRVWDAHPCHPPAWTELAAATASGLYEPYLGSSVADGTCFVALDGPRPVALSGTWPPAHMAAEIADVCMPGTLETHRRQGYARTALSHTTRAILDAGRIPVYTTSDRNKASIATAKAVGYTQYGWEFRIQLPAD